MIMITVESVSTYQRYEHIAIYFISWMAPSSDWSFAKSIPWDAATSSQRPPGMAQIGP